MPAGSSGTCHVCGLDGSRKPWQKLCWLEESLRNRSIWSRDQLACATLNIHRFHKASVVFVGWIRSDLALVTFPVPWYQFSAFVFLPFLGFVGQNCEMDVDACSLANNSCPPGTRCLDLPGGLDYTCRVPCPQSLRVGENLNDRWSHMLLWVLCKGHPNGFLTFWLSSLLFLL